MRKRARAKWMARRQLCIDCGYVYRDNTIEDNGVMGCQHDLHYDNPNPPGFEGDCREFEPDDDARLEAAC